MPRMGWTIVGVVALAAGCRGKVEVPYPNYVPNEPAASISSENAFADYVAAADMVEAATADFKNYVAFDKKARNKAILLSENGYRKLVAARRKPFEFVFAGREPTVLPPHHVGWRMLGRNFVWRIETALSENRTSAAVEIALAGIQFGMNLCGGSVVDATLGLEIVDECRRAIAPNLENFPVNDLKTLGQGIRQILKARPKFESILAHERLNMLYAVQNVQDAVRDNKIGPLVARLGGNSRDTAKVLQSLREDDTMRRDFFQGFSGEIDQEISAVTHDSQQPFAKIGEPDKERDRPWSTLSLAFFKGGRRLLPMWTASLARTRLLGLHAGLWSTVKATGAAPATIKEGDELSIDPYTGLSFVYKADRAAFRAYSTGEDGKDDGGQSDGSGKTPDLVLETINRR